jgi:hypothetical protein
MSAPAYPITRKWTVPAGGSATIQTIINDTTIDKWVIYAAVRAATDNASPIYWKDADGQHGGFVMAGETAILGDDMGSPRLRDFTFTGASGDNLYLTIGLSASGVTQ